MPRCPKCKIQAEPISYEEVRIYNCGSCGGHWLAPTRLDLILERRTMQMPEAVQQKMMDIADDSNTKEPLFCFTCATEMTKRQFRWWDDITLDHCPKCEGIWLDQGELEKCQIYWEYAEDNPEEWKDLGLEERKAMIEVELQRRKQQLKDELEENRNWRKNRMFGFWI